MSGDTNAGLVKVSYGYWSSPYTPGVVVPFAHKCGVTIGQAFACVQHEMLAGIEGVCGEFVATPGTLCTWRYVINEEGKRMITIHQTYMNRR